MGIKFVIDPLDPALQDFGMYKGTQDVFKNVYGAATKQRPKLSPLETLLGSLGAPPARPDPTTLAVRTAGLAERNKQLTNNGRKSSFLSWGLGAAPLDFKTLLGQ